MKTKNLKLLIFLPIVFLFSAQGASSHGIHKEPIASSYNNQIISDSHFLAKNSMTEAQIQSFLTSRNSCLRSYNETRSNFMGVPERYQAQGRRAAHIIWWVANEYGINPQVLLATLQKEQGLITSSSCTNYQLDWAMGYAVPEVGDRDPDKIGFSRQVDWAAWQLRSYNYHYSELNHAGMVGMYRKGNTATIDGKATYISNSATAALYRYTPHRPDSAWLTAANGNHYYGNYNFIYFMNLWFPEFVRSRLPVTTDLYFNSSSVTEGQNSRARFTIRNNHDWPITLERLKVDVRDGSKNQDFAGFNNITIQPGSSYSFDQTKNVTTAGSYRATIRVRVNGAWHTPGGHSVKSLRVAPFNYSSVRLSKPLSFSANRYVGDELTANFELENNNGFGVNLSRVKIDFRKSGTTTDFDGLFNQSVSAGGKLNFIDNITPTSAGIYDARAVYQYNGRWTTLAATKITVNPSSVPTRIEASNLTLTNPNPMAGEEFGVSFYLTNNNPQAVTLDRLKVDIRGTGTSQDIGGLNNTTINPGSSAKVHFSGNEFSRYLTSTGSYQGTLRFNYLGSWYTPRGESGFGASVRSFNSNLISISKALNFSPVQVNEGGQVTATFRLNSSSSKSIQLQRLKIDVRDGSKIQDFSGHSNISISSGTPIEFNQARVITAPGFYRSSVRYMVAGSWYTPPSGSFSSLGAIPFSSDILSVSDLMIATTDGLAKEVYAKDEEVTTSFKLKNNSDTAIMLDRLKVDVRGCGLSFDYSGFSAEAISSNTVFNFYQTREFSRDCSFELKIAVQVAGKWHHLAHTGVSKINIWDSEKITLDSEFYLTNQGGVKTSTFKPGDTINGHFIIKNNNAVQLTLNRVKVDIRRIGAKSLDLVGNDDAPVLVLPGGVLNFSNYKNSKIVPEDSAIGLYSARIRIHHDGGWIDAFGANPLTISITSP